MKRFVCFLQIGLLLFLTTACGTTEQNTNTGENPTDYKTISCSKESVDDFMTIISKSEMGGLYGWIEPNKESCYNVTPLCVATMTDIKIFKFNDSCASFALIDDKAYTLCESFGGYGFVNAIPWDYDEDGNLDLLVASSWGSGLHRSQISVFNTTTKESFIVYDTLTADNPSVDLVVLAVSPAFSSRPENHPVYYVIYTASIEVNNGNLADLSYTTKDVVGSIVLENEKVVFKPTNS